MTQPLRACDLLFCASFALMVTQSVSIAGVLVVLSYLIIPAACAIMLVDNFFRSLLIAWGIALGVSLSGLILSAWKDLPTGQFAIFSSPQKDNHSVNFQIDGIYKFYFFLISKY